MRFADTFLAWPSPARPGTPTKLLEGQKDTRGVSFPADQALLSSGSIQPLMEEHPSTSTPWSQLSPPFPQQCLVFVVSVWGSVQPPARRNPGPFCWGEGCSWRLILDNIKSAETSEFCNLLNQQPFSLTLLSKP